MNVLILHRSPVMGQGLSMFIERSGATAECHTWRSSRALTDELRERKPDVLLFDPELPDIELDPIISAIEQVSPATAVAVISADENPAHMEEAIGSGAQGYISLNAAEDEFLSSLSLLAGGQIVATGPDFDTLADVATADPATNGSPTAGLTPRESELANLLADGLTNRQLAEKLYLTEGTVKVHLRNIFRKLGIANRTELTSHMIRTGLAN